MGRHLTQSQSNPPTLDTLKLALRQPAHFLLSTIAIILSGRGSQLPAAQSAGPPSRQQRLGRRRLLALRRRLARSGAVARRSVLRGARQREHALAPAV